MCENKKRESQAPIQDILMGGGWYSRPPNYTLIYYKLSDVWPEIWGFGDFGFSERGMDSHSIPPPGSAPGESVIYSFEMKVYIY